MDQLSLNKVVAYFRQDATIRNFTPELKYRKKDLAIIPMPENPDRRFMFLDKPDLIELYNIEDIFPDFREFPDARRLIVHCNGGIGDLIAMSSPVEYFNNKSWIYFINPGYAVLRPWFKNKIVEFRGYHDPIVRNYSALTASKYKNVARVNIAWAAIYGGGENWYISLFKRMGIDNPPREYMRPQLVRVNEEAPVDFPAKSVLINHRSSAQMRSSSLVDFYIPVREALPGWTIYVNEYDLSEADRTFIELKKPEIKVIPKLSLKLNLLNLSRVELAVCTDSFSVHFREGIEMRSLAAFGAMTYQSRTSAYKYTRSFNTGHLCEYQPCFTHELRKGATCKTAEPGDITAKCQSGEMFRKKLFQELKKL